MKEDLATFLKGFAMGAANVVPGVSGGTIAFITGIYERLIEALKALDGKALRMAGTLRFRELWVQVDGRFLTALGVGVVVSIVSLARVLEWAFAEHPKVVWALFLGLIAASIPALAKTVRKWSAGSMVALLLGLGIAVSMAFLTPGTPSENWFYLGLCGVAGICSMIIPGLSGSFVLLLMGNYALILGSVNELSSGNVSGAMKVILPVGLGAIAGLLVLSRFLSWLFKAHHNTAVAAITGFVAGSLVIIWPWKDTLVAKVIKNGEETEKITGFSNWRWPDFSSGSVWMEMAALILGVLLILVVDRFDQTEKV